MSHPEHRTVDCQSSFTREMLVRMVGKTHPCIIIAANSKKRKRRQQSQQRWAQNDQETTDTQKNPIGKKKSQLPSASLCPNSAAVTRAQCVNSCVRFGWVRYAKYLLEIVSKVHVKYFLFIMTYYEKYMMQANSASSWFTSAESEGSITSGKGGQR